MKSKNKDTSRRTDTSKTSRSSTEINRNTTTDTLRRFWKQNWHRIASAFVVLLVVASIAYSCGVSAKAYEISPPYYTPYSFLLYDDISDINQEVTVDPNEASLRQGFPDNFNYEVFGLMNTGYVLPASADPITGSSLVSFVNEVDTSRSEWAYREIYLNFNCLDFTPAARSGYLDEISINPGTSVVYSDSYSPLNYIWPCYWCSDVDYTPPITNALVAYSYLDGTTVRGSVERVQFFLPDARDVSRSADTILEQLLLEQLPDNAWITSVRIDLVPILTDFMRTYPDGSEAFSFEIIQEQRPEAAAEMSERFLAALLSPSLVVPDNPSGYQQGYIDGRNSALTERLGVVDWLVDAGDAVMNFRLFSVSGTPITIGSIFTVIMGSLLIIFILKVFAGG